MEEREDPWAKTARLDAYQGVICLAASTDKDDEGVGIDVHYYLQFVFGKYPRILCQNLLQSPHLLRVNQLFRTLQQRDHFIIFRYVLRSLFVFDFQIFLVGGVNEVEDKTNEDECNNQFRHKMIENSLCVKWWVLRRWPPTSSWAAWSLPDHNLLVAFLSRFSSSNWQQSMPGLPPSKICMLRWRCPWRRSRDQLLKER